MKEKRVARSIIYDSHILHVFSTINITRIKIKRIFLYKKIRKMKKPIFH